MIRRDYLIVGAGVGGASVCEGIREHDKKGSVMLVGNEVVPPYHRPLLLKNFLNGKVSPPVEKLQQHDRAWFEKNNIDLRLDTLVTQFNVERKVAVLSNGQAVEFKKACLAMGSRARRPQVAGYNLGNVLYLRSWRDVQALREMLDLEKEIVVVGAGYLAAHAATLLLDRPKTKVSIIHRGRGFWDDRVDPETSQFITEQFASRGAKLLMGETVNGFEGRTVIRNVQTKSGQRFGADLAIVCIGCDPNLGLVQGTPLSYPHGTPVNELLETDEKGIFAVGDIASFPCKLLGGARRFEYWEAAIEQGRVAGQNMTGRKRIKFDYVPHCTAQALDMSFDLVGDFSTPPARFEIEGDRAKKKFVARYYQPAGLMGILLCNQPADRVEAAKEQLRTAPRSAKKAPSI
jgi:3-phenylpropionate/trans-cinnamate dioxygenase ferredoxin reductase subunit